MAHELFGERFLGMRTPAWHNLGLITFNDAMSAVEACAWSGAADIRIGTRKMAWVDDQGMVQPVDDKLVIVRYPTADDPGYKVLGNAANGYTILQNIAICKAIDAAGLTAKWPVDTMGVLHQGATFFTCLNLGADSIAGEKYQRYLFIAETRDGATALFARAVHTRVVCANTMLMAMSEGTEDKIKLQHSSTVEQDFTFALDVISLVQRQSDQLHDALERLADTHVSAEHISELVDTVYPTPRRGSLLANLARVDDPSTLSHASMARMESLENQYQTALRHTAALRDAFTDRHQVLQRDYPVHQGTALGAYNVVAELADHTRNTRGQSAASIVGYRADEKVRAYKYLRSLS